MIHPAEIPYFARITATVQLQMDNVKVRMLQRQLLQQKKDFDNSSLLRRAEKFVVLNAISENEEEELKNTSVFHKKIDEGNRYSGYDTQGASNFFMNNKYQNSSVSHDLSPSNLKEPSGIFYAKPGRSSFSIALSGSSLSSLKHEFQDNTHSTLHSFNSNWSVCSSVVTMSNVCESGRGMNETKSESPSTQVTDSDLSDDHSAEFQASNLNLSDFWFENVSQTWNSRRKSKSLNKKYGDHYDKFSIGNKNFEENMVSEVQRQSEGGSNECIENTTVHKNSVRENENLELPFTHVPEDDFLFSSLRLIHAAEIVEIDSEEEPIEELKSDVTYNAEDFLRDALGNEYYYDSDTTESMSQKYNKNQVTNLLRTKQEELPYHTISSYRNLINKGKSKKRPGIMPSLKVFISCEEPISLRSRGKQLQETLKHLLTEADIQLSIMNQASKALELCKITKELTSSSERIESERVLLLSVLKRNAALEEVQRLRLEDVKRTSFLLNRGSVSIEDLSLRVKEDYRQRMERKCVDYETWFMCVLRHRHCLFGTLAVSEIEDGRINFPGLFRFDKLQKDFKITVQVFKLNVKKELMYDNTKCFQKIQRSPGSYSYTNKKIKRGTKNTCTNLCFQTSDFNVAGSLELSRRDLFHHKPWPLSKVGLASPLFGTIDLQLTSSLTLIAQYSGFLTMFEEAGGLGSWQRRWFHLSDFDLKYWNYPSETDSKEPLGIIDLSRTVARCVEKANRSLCPRPRTLVIDLKCYVNKSDSSTIESKHIRIIRHLLSADTTKELDEWCHALNNVVSALRDWNLLKK